MASVHGNLKKAKSASAAARLELTRQSPERLITRAELKRMSRWRSWGQRIRRAQIHFCGRDRPKASSQSVAFPFPIGTPQVHQGGRSWSPLRLAMRRSDASLIPLTPYVARGRATHAEGFSSGDRRL